MVERRVQPLKLRALLLCHFTGVGDPSQKSMETLEASEVTKWVAKLVTAATVVVVKNIVEAFSVTYRPNLVSPLLLSCSLLVWTPDLVGPMFVPFLHSSPNSTSLAIGASSALHGRGQSLRRRSDFAVRKQGSMRRARSRGSHYWMVTLMMPGMLWTSENIERFLVLYRDPATSPDQAVLAIWRAL